MEGEGFSWLGTWIRGCSVDLGQKLRTLMCMGRLLALSALVWGCASGSDGSGSTEVAPPFVDAAQVAADERVLDVRGNGPFEGSRLPGAVQLDESRLRATVDGVPGQVAAVTDLQAAFGEAGLSADVPVVVYGAATDTTAARVVWTLQYVGMTEVLLMDGGFDAWTGMTESGERVAPEATPFAATVNTEIIADADYVNARLDDVSVVIYDVRTAGEYEAGHIPGAINVDWQSMVRAGALKPADEVRALLEPATGETIVYCQTGSRAAVGFLVLQWLGYPNVRLYDGSWADWSARDGLAVSTGVEP